MLGDNLYDDDYDGEFSRPYKPLLDAGVKFYAALGNHDRDLEIHFKPFNMGDSGSLLVRRGQRALRRAEQQPSSRCRASQVARRRVRRRGRQMADRVLPSPAVFVGPAREGKPRGHPSGAGGRCSSATTWTSCSADTNISTNASRRSRASATSSRAGAGGILYSVHPSPFDQVAVSEHHFMVAEIAGDRLFFEAITPGAETPRLRRALAAPGAGQTG